ncbi:MAG: glycosyltransferase [Vicinamibacterales bacterium]|nr:glycosyltransferase [Vicinamibacterales bacterium]
MKVVHVAAYFAPAFGFGGPPRSLLTLCQVQQAAGMEVEVFTTTANPGRELPARPEGEIVDGVRVRRFVRGAPRAWLGAPTMAAPLEAAAREAGVLHLHGLFNRTIWMAGRIARQAGATYVVSPRGMLEPAALRHHQWRKRVAYALCDGSVLAHAACWHATSPGEAQTLMARPGARPVVEIPNSVDAIDATAAMRAQARAAAGLTDRPYVLFLGRLHPIKRLDLLAEAFADVAATHPGIDLVIAGPDEAGYGAQMRERMAALGARVHWLGAVEGDVKAGLLAGARALVMCSDSESFGMSVAEALAAGTPAVVTRTCPWPSLDAAGAGFWVPQERAAIAEALRRLVDDAALAEAMGARGRALVAREFSAAAVAERWRDCYARVAAGRGSVAPS